MSAPSHRASPVGVISGLLIIGSIVALGSFWLRQYLRDRGEIWMLNGGPSSVVVYVDDEPHTLTSGEVLADTLPAKPMYEVRWSDGERQETLTVTRTPGRQEVILIDVVPGAVYVTLEVTPRFAASGSPAHKKLNEDKKSFTPGVVEVRGPGKLIRLQGGEAATVGPLEGLPGSVYLARRYGRSVHKIMRVMPPVDTSSLAESVERQLAEARTLVELEASLKSPPSLPKPR